MKIELESDLFGIGDRLRSIDEGYFVVYDTQRAAFEVHNRFNRGNTYCLTCPDNALDCRTVTAVQKTRVERIQKLIEELEKENQSLSPSFV